MEEVKIFLKPIDVEKFKQFQKNYELFSILQQEDILNVNYGKIVLNFAGGVLQNVVKEEVVYKR